jgi:hypothetical protein
LNDGHGDIEDDDHGDCQSISGFSQRTGADQGGDDEQ